MSKQFSTKEFWIHLWRINSFVQTWSFVEGSSLFVDNFHFISKNGNTTWKRPFNCSTLTHKVQDHNQSATCFRVMSVFFNWTLSLSSAYHHNLETIETSTILLANCSQLSKNWQRIRQKSLISSARSDLSTNIPNHDGLAESLWTGKVAQLPSALAAILRIFRIPRDNTGKCPNHSWLEKDHFRLQIS